MNFIETEDLKEEIREHSLWVEKHKPSTIEEYIGEESFKDTIRDFIKKNDVPNILLYGDSGVGKSLVSDIIVNNIDCDLMKINASEENGIDIIRNKIKGFASTTGFKKWKIVLLEEMDFLTINAQAALRELVMNYSLTTRFIFTCNYIDKVIPAIHSRSQAYKVEPPNKKDIAIHLKSILEKESIQYSIQDIKYIVNTYYPDIRKVINFAQQSSIDGQLKINELNSVSTSTKTDILELLKSPNSSTFNSIRQSIANAGVRQFDEYYGYLYEKIDEYAKDKQTIIILTIAEYMYQNALVIHKEITFMACIAKILMELLENNN
jgi:DNA polymerase III delta prime subunit